MENKHNASLAAGRPKEPCDKRSVILLLEPEKRNHMVLILITIVLALIFATIERKAIDTRITTGILADLDHKELTAWRIIAWTVCAAILIALDAIIWWKAAAMMPACMAAFATAHRLLINHLRERPLWYLGVGSWYDRKWLELMLGRRFGLADDDDRAIERHRRSAWHYELIMESCSYRKAVRNAGFFAYGLEVAVVIITLVLRSRLG